MSFRIDENWGNSNNSSFSYSSRDRKQLRNPSPPSAPRHELFSSRGSLTTSVLDGKTFSSSSANHFNIVSNRLYNPSRR